MRSRPLVALALLAVVAHLGACQAVLGLEEGKPRGTGGGASSSTASGGGASSTSSTVSSSGSSSATASSTGSSSSTSGTGGAGGATSSSGTGGAGPTCSDGAQNGDETGVDCGGSACPLCPTVLLLATGAPGLVAAGEFHPGGAWLTTMIPATTTEAPGLALTTAGQGVGLIRNATAAPPGPLDDDVEAVIWSAGAWGAFTAIGAAKTRGRPAIVSVDATAQAVVHGVDYKHDYAAWNGAQWAPVNDPVGGALDQSYGPSAPELAVLGADAIAAFIDGVAGSNHLTVQTRKAGVWQPRLDLAASAPSANFAISPTIAAVSGGPELLVLYVRATDKAILWLARTAGSWSVAAPITGAFTDQRVAVTGLAGGGALLAFRGTDSKLYTSRLAAGAWSPPANSISGALLASPPALAPGVGGAEAELAYVDTTKGVCHARSIGNAWTAPTPVAGAPGTTMVAIASLP